MLGANVVADAHFREVRRPACAPPLLCGEVERPLPIWLTTMMKYFAGSSARPLPMYDLLHDLAGSRIPGRNEDRVVLRRVQRAVGRHGELTVRESLPPSSSSRLPMSDQLVGAVAFLAVVGIRAHRSDCPDGGCGCDRLIRSSRSLGSRSLQAASHCWL